MFNGCFFIGYFDSLEAVGKERATDRTFSIGVIWYWNVRELEYQCTRERVCYYRDSWVGDYILGVSFWIFGLLLLYSSIPISTTLYRPISLLLFKAAGLYSYALSV